MIRTIPNSIGRGRRPSLSLVVALVLTSGAAARAQITSSFTQPFEQCAVAACESGVVREIRVREGTTVRKSDILAVLNDGVYRESERLAKLRAESNVRLESTEAVLRLKKHQLDNLIDLSDEGHANQHEVEQAKILYQQALSDHEAAKELRLEGQIELARIQAEIEQRIVRSPIDGIVIKLHKELGEYIAPNDPIVCTVVRLDKLKANFYLDAKVVASIAANDSLYVKIGDVAEPVPALVRFRSPVIDPKSSTGRIEVEIDNAGGSLVSGQPCHLLLSTPRLSAQPSSHR